MQNRVRQRYNTVLGLNKMHRHFLECAEPIGEEIRAIERGRQKDTLDAVRHADHGLLPDLATTGVIDIVAFIKDDEAEVIEGQGGSEADTLGLRALLAQEVAQNLGGHDENLGRGEFLDVPGHEADRCISELSLQIAELLIGQGFDGGGIEDTLPLFQCLIDTEFAYGGLA